MRLANGCYTWIGALIRLEGVHTAFWALAFLFLFAALGVFPRWALIPYGFPSEIDGALYIVT
jgi:hypothetical protein